MTFTIPVWVLWTLAIIAGVFGVLVIGAVLMFVFMSASITRGIGRGLGW